jgi:O6-methylguanine-DNA--protein-cysteine methyltransferase
LDALTMLFALSAPVYEECLDQFCSASYAKTQAVRCHEHLERLRALEASRGWEGGRWRVWYKEVEGQLDYWELLVTVRAGESYPERARAIGRLKERLGAGHFAKGWRPPEMPASWVFQSGTDPDS